VIRPLVPTVPSVRGDVLSNEINNSRDLSP
jgi:hypothetical protein